MGVAFGLAENGKSEEARQIGINVEEYGKGTDATGATLSKMMATWVEKRSMGGGAMNAKEAQQLTDTMKGG